MRVAKRGFAGRWGVVTSWLAAVGLVLTAAVAQAGNVIVLQSDGTSYDAQAGGTFNEAARQRVAKRFYETHSDAYDFIVVLPTFAVDLGADVQGTHWPVRNDVSGIGVERFDSGGAFGSAKRLKAVIDVGALVPGAAASSLAQASAVLAHEVAHQWSGRVRYKDPVTGQVRSDLLSPDGRHWSYFLDSDGSVLYGADWQQKEPGVYEAVRSLQSGGRYSDLDLYLMGLGDVGGSSSVVLLSPVGEVAETAGSPAPAEGTLIKATPRTISISDIQAVQGVRSPAGEGTRGALRAAFVLLTPKGTAATSAQLAFVDALRTRFENDFFFLTRGRAVFETSLVESPPEAVADNPSVRSGLEFLLAKQSTGGAWNVGDSPDVRSTQAALEALGLFFSDPRVPAAVGRARDRLRTLSPADADSIARQAIALEGTGFDDSRLKALRESSPAGDVGLSRGYGASVIDTALLELAVRARGWVVPSSASRTAKLLGWQNADGGWPLYFGGPSHVETTALVLQALIGESARSTVRSAAAGARVFLNGQRQPNGLFGTGQGSAGATAEVLVALAAWHALDVPTASAGAQALLGSQLRDGSWAGSVAQTARALRALRLLMSPNLAIAPGDVSLSANRAFDGERVLASVKVANTGYVEARQVRVQGFDAAGRPFGAPVVLPSLAAGASSTVSLELDTTGHAGVTQVFVVVDSESELGELTEADNRAAAGLSVFEVPEGADLYVQAGSVSVNPTSVSRFPAQVTVTAVVGNVGRTQVAEADVAVRVGDTQVLLTRQAFPAQSRQTVSWVVSVPPLTKATAVTVHINPSGDVPEEGYAGNNSASGLLEVTPAVDVAVTQLSLGGTAEQGRDVSIAFDVENFGSAGAVTQAQVRVETLDGVLVSSFPPVPVEVAPGARVTRKLTWRASVAGGVRVVVTTAFPADVEHSNDARSATLDVKASALANLLVAGNTLQVSPELPLETKPVTVSAAVKNTGSATAANFAVDFYLGAPDAGGKRVARQVVDVLAAGASRPVSATFTLPRSSPDQVWVVLDADGVVAEFDEDDNRTLQRVQPQGIPDFALASPDIRPQTLMPQEGQSVPVVVSVRNAGGQESGEAQVALFQVLEGQERSVGTATVGPLAAGARGEASFTWDTSGLTGTQRLVAVVTPEGGVDEARTDNNRAERSVVVQDGRLALTELYFSPNGDGVKDVTEVVYRLDEAAGVSAHVYWPNRKLLRALVAPSAREGRVEWDGKDAEGHVVPDGAYEVEVTTGAGRLVGTLVATVDTNRLPLERTTPDAFEANDFAELWPQSNGYVLASSPRDGDFVLAFSGDFPCRGSSLHVQALTGGPAPRVDSDCVTVGASPGFRSVAVSPDAQRVAYELERDDVVGESRCENYRCYTLKVRDLGAQWPLTLAVDQAEAGKAIRLSRAVGPPVWAVDGQRLYFLTDEVTLATGNRRHRVESVLADGTGRRVLYESDARIVELIASPDGRRLSLLDAHGALWLLGLDGGATRLTPDWTVASGVYPADGLGPVGRGVAKFEGQPGSHVWLPSGDAIAFIWHGLMRVDSMSSDGPYYAPVSMGIKSVSVLGGALATLYTSETAGNGRVERLVPNPKSGALLFMGVAGTAASSTRGLHVVEEGGVARHLPSVAGQFSLQGTALFSEGSSRVWTSRANLAARLAATRRLGLATFQVRGTAYDANFEEWELGVRPYRSTAAFVAVARSESRVANGLLTEWTPAAPGTYELQLLVRDRAGNVRTQRTTATYSPLDGLVPAVANVQRSTDAFSPNGDGVKDTVALRYTLTRPYSTEFLVLAPDGRTVRHLPRTHPEPGEYALEWDGRDDEGALLADGDYTFVVDSTRLQVALDTTPPRAEFAFRRTGPDGKAVFTSRPTGRPAFTKPPSEAYPPYVKYEDSDVSIEMPVVLSDSTADDVHFDEWVLEASEPSNPTRFQSVNRGTTRLVAQSADVPVHYVSGRQVRLRVSDSAGNTAVSASDSIALERRLLLNYWAATEMLDGGEWSPFGTAYPSASRTYRVFAPLLGQIGNYYANMGVAEYPPGDWTFGFTTTATAPIVDVSVVSLWDDASHPGEFREVDERPYVQLLGNSAFRWDASRYGHDWPQRARIRATDADGNTYEVGSAFVGVDGGRGDVWLPPLVKACAAARTPGLMALKVMNLERFSPEELAVAKWRLVRGSEVANGVLELEVPYASDATGVQFIATGGLVGCQYSVFLMAGSGKRVGTDVDVCRLQLTTDGKSVQVAESQRQAVVAVDVFAAGQESTPLARFASVSGASDFTPLETASLSCGTSRTLRARATLADGSVRYTYPNNDDVLFEECNDEAVLELPPSRLSVSRPLPNAPLACAARPAGARLEVEATSCQGGGLGELVGELRDGAGVVRARFPLNAEASAEAGIKAAAQLPVTGLADGTYYAVVVAKPQGAAVMERAAPVPYFVDTTPPIARVTPPASGVGAVCKQQRRGADGQVREYISVSGQVSDAHLTAREVVVRGEGGVVLGQDKRTYDGSAAVAQSGALLDVDVTGVTGAVEVALSAEDVGGNSVCAAPVVLEVAEAVRVTQASVSPGLYSPDGDGALDTTQLSFGLSQPAEVTVTAFRGETPVGTLFAGSLGAGPASLTLSGELLEGGRLTSGDYTLRVKAQGGCGEAAEARVGLQVDTDVPLARIDAPEEASVVAAAMAVMGEASDAHFRQAELWLGEGSAPASFARLGAMTGPVRGTLGQLPGETLADGEYTLKLVVVDAVGHRAEARRLFVRRAGSLLRLAQAQPALLSPANVDGVLDATDVEVELVSAARVSLSLATLAGVQVRELEAATDWPAGRSARHFGPDTLGSLPDGDYVVLVQAEAQGVVDSARIPLTLDSTPPRLVALSPGLGAFTRAEVTVTGTVEDAHLEAWSVRRELQGGSAIPLAEGTAAPSGALAVLGGLEEGLQRLVVTARDAAGNQAEAPLEFTVDTRPPEVAFLSPAGGSFLSGLMGPLEVRGRAQDAQLRHVRLEWVKAGGAGGVLFEGEAVPDGGLLAAWAITAAMDGEAQLRLTAEDAAGNRADALIDVTLDSTPPVARLAQPLEGAVGFGGDFRGTASDERLAQWRLLLARGEGGFEELASSSQSVTDGTLTLLTSVADGPYTARLVAVDKAGNVSSDEAAFVLDTQPPKVQLRLTAQLERPSDVHLAWEASASADVVGFAVLRTVGGGVWTELARVGPDARTYLDTGLADGRYGYVVRALDAAGNRSEPSNTAEVDVDLTPPLVSFAAPAADSTVRDVVAVVGTASAPTDMREYRLLVGAGEAPNAFTLLAQGNQSVVNARLADWSVTALPEGSLQTLRLEAEDTVGNQAHAEVRVRVDNAPPAAPHLVQAAVSGRNVNVTWDANAEEDLLGYVLLRDGQPVLASGGVTPEDLRTVALPADGLSYYDQAVVDGVHTYTLLAVDRAGNVSPPSNALDATVETRAPSVRIVEPPAFARLRESADVVGHSDDADLAKVQFEVRPSDAAAFSPVGPAVTTSPYRMRLDVSPYVGRLLEVQARGTDKGGRTDDSPVAVAYIVEAVPATPKLTARVDEDRVLLDWTPQGTPVRMGGYVLTRDGTSVTPAPARPQGAVSATVASSWYPASAAWDEDPWSYWSPGSGTSGSWQVEFSEAHLLDGVQVRVGPSYTPLRVDGLVGGRWVTLVPSFDVGTSSSVFIPLSPALEVEGVRLARTNSGNLYLYDVRPSLVRVEKGTAFTDVGRAPGSYSYSVAAMGWAGTASAEASVQARVWAPTLTGPASPTASARVRLTGAGAGANAAVRLLTLAGVEVAALSADAGGGFAADVTLAEGDNTFVAQATDAAGNRSLKSAPLTLRYAPAPVALAVLRLTGVSGSDVALAFDVSGDTSRVAAWGLVRTGADGSPVQVARVAAEARSVLDAHVPNGTYAYHLVALNADGLAGQPSNTVTARVAVEVPTAPEMVSVTAPPQGGALQVVWRARDALTSAFRLERAVGATGAWQTVSGLASTQATSTLDKGLTNGVTYHYRVLALDAAGNASAPSAPLSGVPRDGIAPAAPRFTYPTVAGTPVTLTTPATSVKGTAEPGTRVTLLRNGLVYGEAAVTAMPPTLKPVALSQSAGRQFAVSPDGQRVAYFVQDADGHAALYVEVVGEGRAERVFRLAGVALNAYSRPVFSPDGQQLLVQGAPEGVSAGGTYVARLSDGSLVPLLPVDAAPYQYNPTWSPDAQRVALTAYDSGWNASLVVVDVASGSWRPVETLGTAHFLPRFVQGGQALVALEQPSGYGQPMKVVRYDLAQGEATELLSGYSVKTIVSPSADGTRLALVLGEVSPVYGSLQWDVYVLDVGTGALQRRTNDWVEEGGAVFSPNGEKLAYSASAGVWEVGEGAPEFLANVEWGATLAWPEGQPLHVLAETSVSRLERSGTFVFDDVPLAAEGVTFGAVARDEGGNVSPPAQPIEVYLDGRGLADLALEARLVPAAPREGQGASVYLTVRNVGAVTSQATELTVGVAAAAGPPVSLSVPPLVPGGTSSAIAALPLAGLEGAQVLEAVVDAGAKVPDANRANNAVRWPFTIVSDALPRVAVAVTPGEVGPGGEALATVTVTNPGEARTLSATAELVDAAGVRVVSLGDAEVYAPMQAGQVATFTRAVPVGDVLAGGYSVRVRLWEGEEKRDEAQAALRVVAQEAGALELATSRAEYLWGEEVGLSSRVTNVSANALLTGARLVFTVEDAQGAPVYLEDVAVPVLARGASVRLGATAPTQGWVPGAFVARAALVLDGQTLATAERPFLVRGQAHLVGSLALSGGGGTPYRVRAGGSMGVTFEARNTGTATETAVAFEAVVMDVESLTVVARQRLEEAPLPPGAAVQGAFQVPTEALPLKAYAVALLALRPQAEAETLASARFEVVDSAAPTLRALNLTDGMYVQGVVRPRLEARDDASGVAAVRVALDDSGEALALQSLGGSPLLGEWEGEVVLGADGPHVLRFSASDWAGNDGRLTPRADNPLVLTVISDTLAPQVRILGVPGEGPFHGPLTPVVEAADANLSSVYATLNGQPFVSGTPVALEGDYDLEATATDKAGNQGRAQARFTLDTSAPRILFGGVAEGAFRNTDVTPTLTVTDRYLDTSSASLDGQPFVAGTVVSGEGAHVLRVTARDTVGNVAEAELHFTLDKTAPLARISGVAGGVEYEGPVYPAAEVTDANLLDATITLNGQPFVSGTEVRAAGDYTLLARGTDKAGNVGEALVSFTITDVPRVDVVKVPGAGGARVAALLMSGTCRLSDGEAARMEAFLRAHLTSAAAPLAVARDDAAFLRLVRSGRYNTFLYASLWDEARVCGSNGETQAPASQERVAWGQSVTEAVHAGRAGFLVVRTRPDNLPRFREVLGSDYMGRTQRPSARFTAGTLSGLASVDTPAASTILKPLYGPDARVAAEYLVPTGTAAEGAATTNVLGAGRSVAFGFDPSKAADVAAAAAALQRAVAWVAPTADSALPLGVAGMEVRLSAPAKAGHVRVREVLETPLGAQWASAPGVLAEDGASVRWEDVEVPAGGSVSLRYLARLPAAKGEYATFTEVTALTAAGERAVGLFPASFTVPRDAGGLLADARSAATLLPDTARRKVEAALDAVAARTVASATDAQANLDDLNAAVDQVRPLGTDGMRARTALDELILYWEAKWFSY